MGESPNAIGPGDLKLDNKIRDLERRVASGDPEAEPLLRNELRKAGLFRPLLYLSERVRTLLESGPVSLSEAVVDSGDGCGAVVRMIGTLERGGHWLCPVCGINRPYVFWSFRSWKPAEKEILRVSSLGVIPLRNGRGYSVDPGLAAPELIRRLSDDSCVICGEGNPPCRCVRKTTDTNV